MAFCNIHNKVKNAQQTLQPLLVDKLLATQMWIYYVIWFKDETSIQQ